MIDYLNLLLEGGLGGHMNHLYENGQLTFSDLKEVLKLASKGKLVGTEKTDGQNIKLSFSVKKQTAVGARNSTQIKEGGLSKSEMTAFFTDHPNPNLKLAFSDAINIFEKAVKLLDVEQQIELFGSNSDIWYNAEIMDDRTRNVVNYDTRNLLIHRTGHALYDRTTGKTVEDETGKTDKKAIKFMNFLEKVQNKVSNKRHAILVNPIQNLKELNNKEALRTAINEIEQIMTKYSLSDKNTINDFLRNDLNLKIKTRLPEQIKSKIISNFLDIGPKVGKKELKKDLSPELKQEVDVLIESGVTLMKESIRPLEIVITDFAAEMLKTLNSIFIIDNKAETQRLSKEVQQAIKNIESSGKKGDLDFLNRQLEKLKGVDTISSAVEGFAFSYKGNLYKFTGKFAPVNQILGLSKYGRGSKSSNTDLTEASVNTNKYDIALLAGGFKPPHKGHIELIKQLASKADQVVVLTSDTSSKERKFKTGDLKNKIIDGKKSNKLLKQMISDTGLTNVELKITPTPLRYIFEYVEKEAQYGESILLGVGDKEDDANRFANISNYIPKGSNVKVDIEILKPISFNGAPLSASRMREIISNKNLKQLIDFIPNEINNKTGFAQNILDMFHGDSNKNIKDDIQEDVFKLFTEDAINEISAMGAGVISGPAVSYDKIRDKKMKEIKREQFIEELKLRKTIREALILRQKNKNKILKEETILRNIIRNIINEAKRDINYGNTGLNVLADLLGGSFRDGITSVYKNLETEKSQRDNFKNKFLELCDKLFNESEMNVEAGESADSEGDSSSLEEEVNISLDGDDDDKIIPDFVYGTQDKKQTKQANKQDKNIDKAPYEIKVAVDFFNSWRDEIETNYSSLDNSKDRQMYREYFMANVPAILDVAESALSKEAKVVNTTPAEDNTNVQTDTSTDLPDQKTVTV